MLAEDLRRNREGHTQDIPPNAVFWGRLAWLKQIIETLARDLQLPANWLCLRDELYRSHHLSAVLTLRTAGILCAGFALAQTQT